MEYEVTLGPARLRETLVTLDPRCPWLRQLGAPVECAVMTAAEARFDLRNVKQVIQR